MSRIAICDGCGQPSEHELISLGHVIKRDYCSDCLPRALVYVHDMDEIRKRLADAFHVEHMENIKRYNGFKLPDVA